MRLFLYFTESGGHSLCLNMAKIRDTVPLKSFSNLLKLLDNVLIYLILWLCTWRMLRAWASYKSVMFHPNPTKALEV